jgi:hypothetical protein
MLQQADQLFVGIDSGNGLLLCLELLADRVEMIFHFSRGLYLCTDIRHHAVVESGQRQPAAWKDNLGAQGQHFPQSPGFGRCTRTRNRQPCGISEYVGLHCDRRGIFPREQRIQPQSAQQTGSVGLRNDRHLKTVSGIERSCRKLHQ